MPIWQTPLWSKKSLESPRPEVTESPSPEELPPSNPLETIRNILGELPRDDFEQPTEIDFCGLTLQEYVSQLRRQASLPVLREFFDLVADWLYATESKAYTEIQTAISASESLLQSMDTFLLSIQQDLKCVSGEIQALQDRSISLSRHLQNRKAVDCLLSPIIDDIIIPPSMVMRLSESGINEAWLRDLDQIEKKIELFREGKYRHVAAVNEIQPYLDKLEMKIIERVRNFIVDLVKAIRFPEANLSSIQQTSFLRCTRPFRFLKRRNEQLAAELGQAYINTLKWYFSCHFERYSKTLAKLQSRLLGKSDVLANKRSGLFGAAAKLEPFHLGDRSKILASQESSIINTHMVEDTKHYFHLETIFNSFNYVVIDNASAEYLFLVEFFGYSSERTSLMFGEIFGPTFDIGRGLVSTFISENMNVLGLLLCIRLTQAYAFRLQRLRVPVLEGYINGLLIELWPRFQRAMDAHGEGLRKHGMKISEADVPHPLTRQFGQFLEGILSLETSKAENEPLNSSVVRLVGDFESAMAKLSLQLPQEQRDPFLFRNYSYVSDVLSGEGKLVQQQKEYFDKLLGMYRGY